MHGQNMGFVIYKHSVSLHLQELAEAQFTPVDFLNSEYGDTTTSNEDDTCVSFNLVTNRNSLVRESGEDGACASLIYI